MECHTCPHCDAIWINGQHYWRTGRTGSEEDLASLVCSLKDFPNCINPLKGSTEGQTWGDKAVKVGLPREKGKHLIDMLAKFLSPHHNDNVISTDSSFEVKKGQNFFGGFWK